MRKTITIFFDTQYQEVFKNSSVILPNNEEINTIITIEPPIIMDNFGL